MGTWAGTGEALAWDIASDVPSTSPSQGSNSGAHRESYRSNTVRICTLLNVHVPMTRVTSLWPYTVYCPHGLEEGYKLIIA